MSNDVNKSVVPANLEQMIELIKISTQGARFQFKISANSKKDSIEFCENYIKLKISKPALQGQANTQVVKFLSEILNVPKNNIKILNGEKSSLKMLLIVAKTLQ